MVVSKGTCAELARLVRVSLVAGAMGSSSAAAADFSARWRLSRNYHVLVTGSTKVRAGDAVAAGLDNLT